MPSNQALPLNAPPLATASRIASCARVAVNLRERRVQGRVPAEGFGVDVEGHGRHGERGAGGDGRAVGVADGEVFGAHPAGEFVALADGESDGGGANEGVRVLLAGFDAEGLGRVVVDVGIGRGGAVDDGELVDGCLIDGSRGVGGDGDQTKEKCAHGRPSWGIRIAELGLVGFVGFGRRRDFVANERVLGFGGKFGVHTDAACTGAGERWKLWRVRIAKGSQSHFRTWSAGVGWRAGRMSKRRWAFVLPYLIYNLVESEFLD